MPTYVYQFIEDGTKVELFQSIHEDAYSVLEHPVTKKESPVRRLYVGVGTILRGSGYYRNDSRPRETAGE